MYTCSRRFSPHMVCALIAWLLTVYVPENGATASALQVQLQVVRVMLRQSAVIMGFSFTIFSNFKCDKA